MARATNGLGQFRGKVGAVVFRVNQGKQIASAYQPAVKNPKSNLQTAQRNKMYLASQISKLIPKEDIIGLAPRGTTRDRRSMFIKNIINNSVSSLENGVFRTDINWINLYLSNGGLLDGMSVSTDGSNGEITLTFDKSKISQDDFNRLAIKIIEIEAVGGEFPYQNYKSAWIDLGEYDTTSTNTSFKVTITIAPSGGIGKAISIIPVMLADNVRYSAERKTFVQLSGDEFVILGQYDINRAVLKWYTSSQVRMYGGNTEPIPPSTDGDEVVNPDGPNFPNLG